jgi:hypothetical protein
VRRLEVADAAVLDVRDAASAEFELQQVGMVGRAHQHRLLLERCSLLVLGEHTLADLYRLVGLVSAMDELRQVAVGFLRPKPLGIGARCPGRDLVGEVKNRLCRAVILL